MLCDDDVFVNGVLILKRAGCEDARCSTSVERAVACGVCLLYLPFVLW